MARLFSFFLVVVVGCLMEGAGGAREGVLTLLLNPPPMAFPGVNGCIRGLYGVRFIIPRRLAIPLMPLTSCSGLDDRCSGMV